MGCANSSAVMGPSLNENPICVTLLGLSGVGKTSLIEYVAGVYNPDDPPIHTNGIVLTDIIIGQLKYRFYDVSGFPSHTSEWNKCIGDSDCVIYVVDPTGIDAGLAFTQDTINRTRDNVVSRKLPVYILLNKAPPETSLENIYSVMEKYFYNVPHEFGRIHRLNNDVLKIFEWIQTQVQKKT
ncbi:ADP-ribosylation factor, putative [Trichomonas vaginalis G3]|uniref:ADP-ribosylation factor, putative n=1 Tax=Trichomonas vaginalis (strain ATCC PRA-98 / G3) TaxID=412133 RepID=A2EIT1_TRIV3|nr:ADP-ribosylation factor-like protein 8 family [Trichomonas vaginalis G3]EAY07415.1 ADP-ribosylation factor, putative [Trichomonas vaginalis G3]KAI5484625.1 ADP-ribosylation factor-like protein 8 family [Trichomonas vaginalis G3]|eukprot:XP_001319638.1 ADP-ribosylation factor [Trichomonas vaginalis G3]